MNSARDTAALPAVGCPIRTPPDHSLVSGSPKLFAATRVLRRLLLPRHPSCALSSLVNRLFFLHSSSQTKTKVQHGPPTRVNGRAFRLSLFTCAYAVVKDRLEISSGLVEPSSQRAQEVELIGIEPMTSSLQSWRLSSSGGPCAARLPLRCSDAPPDPRCSCGPLSALRRRVARPRAQRGDLIPAQPSTSSSHTG